MVERCQRCKCDLNGRTKYCKECRSYHNKKHYSKKLDGYYSVYYLPEEHYCGVTNCVEIRIKDHEKSGKNTEGWKVLYCSPDYNVARHHENLFHSLLGMEGISYT